MSSYIIMYIRDYIGSKREKSGVQETDKHLNTGRTSLR